MPTSTPDRSSTDRLAKQRLYRRLLVGTVVGGTAVGLVLREGLGYPLAGEAVYWLGLVGFLVIWQGTSVRLFDERHRALERRASQLTLALFAVVLIVGASSARVLSYTGTYDVPSAIGNVLWGYVALYVVFGIVYLGLRYRS